MAYGKLYRIVEDKVPQKLGPQPGLIVRAMLDNPSGLTVKQIAEKIKDKLVTRQDPARVVNFYMSTWQKKGIVQVAGEVEETPVSTGNSGGEVEAGDIADNASEEPISEEAARNLPTKYDYATGTLKEAILQSLKEHGGGTAMDIHHNLQVAGREVKVKAVADSISKLVKELSVGKDADGRIFLPEHANA